MRPFHRRPIVACLFIGQVLLLALGSAGCATVPVVQVDRPWRRVLNSDGPISPRSNMSVSVENVATPLIGASRLVDTEMQQQLAELLERRGFVLGNSASEYAIKLLYRTQASERSIWSTSYSSNSSSSGLVLNTSGVGALSGNGYGMGVAIAQSIVAQSAQSASAMSTGGKTQTVYGHAIAIELSHHGSVVWKGETLWDSYSPNVLRGAKSAIQMLLSGLPSDPSLRVPVPAVKESAAWNFYREYFLSSSYDCPALPISIEFSLKTPRTSASFEGALTTSGGALTKSGSRFDAIKSPAMMVAYLDLIQTAEFAVPAGSAADWEDPTDVNLWRRATLGGQYVVGPQKLPANVIIELKGNKFGYVVENAQVVSDEDYAKFQNRMDLWQKALREYYDFYAR